MRVPILPVAALATVLSLHAAPGHFRVERQVDGRWWAISPAGARFVPLGVDHVKYEGFCCELENWRQRYREANDAKFGKGNVDAWREDAFAKLRAWGFNMLGGGCKTNILHRGLPYTWYLPVGRNFIRKGDPDSVLATEMPNVFSPRFGEFCRWVAARECGTRRDDPDCFGYYLDNELHWWGKGGPSARLGLYDAARELPPEHSARKALDAFAAARGIRDAANPSTEDKVEFARLVARTFFETCTKSIRAADPNHLVLGTRFAGLDGAPDVVWEECGRWCDVVTLNVYPCADIDRNVMLDGFSDNAGLLADALAAKHALCGGRPLMITEWSFPALDSGLPCTKGAGQRFRTQRERAAASELFARTVLSLPFVIGYNYFMWVDEPRLGISKAFAENSNYGLVRECGEPYAELTEMFARLQGDPAALRRASAPQPRPAPARSATADEMAVRARLAPGAPATVAGTAYAVTNAVGMALEGLVGRGQLLSKISLGGKKVGSLGALLALVNANGQLEWRGVGGVASAKPCTAGGLPALELTTESRGKDFGYRITYVIRAAARERAFLVEMVRCENVGARPLKPDSFYFLPDAPFALAGVPSQQVPNLWRAERKDCWVDPASGRWIGALTLAPRVRIVRFWLNQAKTYAHSDVAVRPPEPVEIPPGATYVPPPGTIYALVMAGTDGRAGWHARTDPICWAR